MSGKGKKKDGAGGKTAEEPEPDEEEKELIERELVISYLKSKLGRFGLHSNIKLFWLILQNTGCASRPLFTCLL